MMSTCVLEHRFPEDVVFLASSLKGLSSDTLVFANRVLLEELSLFQDDRLRTVSQVIPVRLYEREGASQSASRTLVALVVKYGRCAKFYLKQM